MCKGILITPLTAKVILLIISIFTNVITAITVRPRPGLFGNSRGINVHFSNLKLDMEAFAGIGEQNQSRGLDHERTVYNFAYFILYEVPLKVISLLCFTVMVLFTTLTVFHVVAHKYRTRDMRRCAKVPRRNPFAQLYFIVAWYVSILNRSRMTPSLLNSSLMIHKL